MLEAMLFGYERGAFTGALNTHAGKFEQAQGGTLLLDEITEMPLGAAGEAAARAAGEAKSNGSAARTPVALDVRVLATTNRRLREEVGAGRFREDLYYRLNVFPSRDRAVARAPRGRAAACHAAARRRAAAPGTRIPALSADAAHLLLTYHWPGNVRELDNLLQRALILVNGPVIEPEHIQFELLNEMRLPDRQRASRARRPHRSPTRSTSSETRTLILEALRDGGSSRREVAERLGISPRTLRHKLARLREAGVEVPAA